MPERGLLIVISGPSGSGKGTVLAELFKRRKGIFYSVSATTRSPRPGEVDGKNYFFLSKEEFEKSIASGGMLEYACYCGNYYGTPRAAVEERLARGEDVVLEIEVQGAHKVRGACPEAVSVFLMPPSVAELEKRLRGRGTESEETILGRLDTARTEMKIAHEYDHVVVNDDVVRAADEISDIIDSEKRSRAGV